MIPEKKRDGFTFYWSFYESVSELSEEDQKNFYKYVIEYALLEKKPSIEDRFIKSIFSLVAPNIDSSIRKYDQRKKAKKGKTKQERTKLIIITITIQLRLRLLFRITIRAIRKNFILTILLFW